MKLRIAGERPIGIALSPGRVAGPVGTRALDGAGGTDALTTALQELRRELPGSGRLDVALLPPALQLRQVELPRLADDELRSVLARDVERYLRWPAARPLVALSQRAAGRRSPVQYVASFADPGLVDGIHAAATQAGWRVGRVVSAYDAWTSWVMATFAGARNGVGYLVLTGADRVEALRFEEGHLTLCRRFLPSPPIHTIIGGLAEVEISGPWLVTVGHASDEVRQVAAARALSILEGDECKLSPDELAAGWATRAAGGDLVPESVRAQCRHRAGRTSRRLLAASAALLVVAAGLHLWGAQRELAAVRGRRDMIAKSVARAVELRGGLQGLDARLQALTAAEAGASRWSGVIADVADHLPRDAHLIGLRASGDSLQLQGVAGRAAGVFESLQRADRMVGIRAEAPIRQESPDSGPPVESFTLGARLSGYGAENVSLR